MSFPNLYYKRTAAAAKACYICYKPTITVLATIDTTDFLYTCALHLSDHGFATHVFEPEIDYKIGASLEEIAKVKEEWEDKQKQKRKKEKEKQKEKADKDTDKAKDKDKAADESEKKEDDTKLKVPGPLPTSGSSTPKPIHEKYILHRDIFALRVSEHRRRRQTSQAKDLAPRLPGAPSSSLS